MNIINFIFLFIFLTLCRIYGILFIIEIIVIIIVSISVTAASVLYFTFKSHSQNSKVKLISYVFNLLLNLLQNGPRSINTFFMKTLYNDIKVIYDEG